MEGFSKSVKWDFFGNRVKNLEREIHENEHVSWKMMVGRPVSFLCFGPFLGGKLLVLGSVNSLKNMFWRDVVGSPICEIYLSNTCLDTLSRLYTMYIICILHSPFKRHSRHNIYICICIHDILFIHITGGFNRLFLRQEFPRNNTTCREEKRQPVTFKMLVPKKTNTSQIIWILVFGIHPGKLTWNPKMEVWKMLSFSKGWFSCSM